ncbi:MAG: hypothetical protein P1U53_00285 [Sulfitobacter sp.]|nr:hypothetical protein [Sulfitobacter sp.]
MTYAQLVERLADIGIS